LYRSSFEYHWYVSLSPLLLDSCLLTLLPLAYYDRVIVMDGGKVAEFDTVLNLFDKETSIFRSLCDEANLQRADIVRIRAENGVVELREEGKAMDEA
jgi:ATP-binding cassette subfamily C (CFTR/MRP) protein 1